MPYGFINGGLLLKNDDLPSIDILSDDEKELKVLKNERNIL